MSTLCLLFLASVLPRIAWPANLAVSTYLKDGFTPSAIAADAQGNIYLSGSAITDAASATTSAMVAKLDPMAAQYLYLTYLDSAAGDQVSALAVDVSGNAYVTGWTANPNFPVVGGGALGTAPSGGGDTRPFVAKLNPQGAIVFSVLIGGTATSTARGIAVTPLGRILVSGIAGSSGFPSTDGALRAADSKNQWFLMELSPTADKMVFSATGIGGSSIALDAAGNIFMAGSGTATDYPTTSGAYQTAFVQGSYCFGFCRFGFPGNLQHVTKVDAAASKLIYSTGLNNAAGRAGSTTNTGLAVDAAGNAYVTGTLFEAEYPFTVPTPSSTYAGFVTKLDSAGANLLFSVPVGGGGVQVDASGSVYVGGAVVGVNPLVSLFPSQPVAPPAVFSWVPRQCWPNYLTALRGAYVMKLDGTTGAVRDAQWIDGSAPGATAIALAGGKVWMTGSTPAPDVPFSAGAVAPRNLEAGVLNGAYLSAVDFTSGTDSRPAIACVLDAGNLAHVGPVAPFQLISIFGANLGPPEGGAAQEEGATSLAGVSVTFDGNPARLLYASSTQINVAVPAPPLPPPPLPAGSLLPAAAVMRVTRNGASVDRAFPLTPSGLNVFADPSSSTSDCPNATTVNTYAPVVLNPDGSRNSCTNPARYGSAVSFFAHGAGGIGAPYTFLNGLQVTVGACSAAVTNTTLVTDFVYRVDVALPASPQPCGVEVSGTQAPTYFYVMFNGYNGAPVGPLRVPLYGTGPDLEFNSVVNPMPMMVWVE